MAWARARLDLVLSTSIAVFASRMWKLYIYSSRVRKFTRFSLILKRMQFLSL